MLKKTVSYTNFNDEEVTEDHYFHLSKAELVEMELSMEGGLSKHLQNLVESGDGGTIMKTFKTLLLDAYGKKSADGRSFIKTQEIKDEFASSEVYSQIFMELATNADAAAEFVNGIIPAGLDAEVEKFQAQQDKPETPKPLEEPRGIRGGVDTGGHPSDPAAQPLGVSAAVDPIKPTEQRVLTMAEAQAMDAQELQSLLSTGKARIGSTEG